MDWLDALADCRAQRVPAVLVTVADVRGHAPREAGAKMVVTAVAAHGSVGGGNLEEVATARARALLSAGEVEPRLESTALTDRVVGEYGVQCCGGEVTLLLEPVPVRPAFAVFGLGHVGVEIALLLSRHPVELHLVDSRPDQPAPEQLALLERGPAAVRVHREPVLPELAIATLPPGTHCVVLTHDHAEDLALLDALLRSSVPGSIGVIGSSAKWVRFRSRLAELGHAGTAIDRVRTPLGDRAGLPGKDPATIALAAVTELLTKARARTA